MCGIIASEYKGFDKANLHHRIDCLNKDFVTVAMSNVLSRHSSKAIRNSFLNNWSYDYITLRS